MPVNADEQVSKGLKLLRKGLLPFVEQEMERRYGTDWHQLPEVAKILQQQPKKKGSKLHLDTQALLNILWNYWNDVFTHILRQEERNLVSELRMARNKSAHDESFSLEDAYRVFDSIARLLKATTAQEVAEVEQIKQELVKELSYSHIEEKENLNTSPTDRASTQPEVESVTSTQTIDSTGTSSNIENTTIPSSESETDIATADESKCFAPYDESIKLLEEDSTKIGSPETDSPQPPLPLIDGENVSDTSTNNPSPVPIPSLQRSPIPVWMKVGGTVLTLSFLALGAISVPYFQKPKLQASSLTIGTLGSPKYQADLADYLREQLIPADFGQFLQGKKVKVVIDGDKTLPYQEAERRIASKEWDIAFTLSPVISVTAKDSGYTFAAQMFPGSKSYQSALFVRADSPIKSVDDIKPTTVIALGGFNSASSFYMPSYDLYGKRVTVDIGNRGPEILKLVKTGLADVGAAAVGDTVKANDPSVRIIHLSREIPSSGVYLSPKLSTEDRQTVAKLLLSAPEDIQKKANYGAGEEPNFSFFREIISKAESIQVCSDFTKNPINFFCADNYKPTALAGKVNGWSYKSNARILNLRESSGKTYRIAVTSQLLAEAIGNSEPLAIQGKEIQVKTNTTPQLLADGSFELKLTQARQLKLLATSSQTDIK